MNKHGGRGSAGPRTHPQTFPSGGSPCGRWPERSDWGADQNEPADAPSAPALNGGGTRAVITATYVPPRATHYKRAANCTAPQCREVRSLELQVCPPDCGPRRARRAAGESAAQVHTDSLRCVQAQSAQPWVLKGIEDGCTVSAEGNMYSKQGTHLASVP